MNARNENLAIVIPARKNSKRLKNKNRKYFHGFPLVEWSLAAGLFLKNELGGSSQFSVICSSDDDQILDLVREKYNSCIFTVQRKPELSGDEAILSDVIIDCVHCLADQSLVSLKDHMNGRFILLQPTSPIRLTKDLVSFCKLVKDLGDYQSAVSVNKNYNIMKDIYEIISDKEINNEYAIGKIGKQFFRPQDINENTQTAFIDGSLYSGSMSILKEQGAMPKGNTLAFPLSTEYSVDIDTEEEFEDALILIKKLQDAGINYVKPIL